MEQNSGPAVAVIRPASSGRRGYLSDFLEIILDIILVRDGNQFLRLIG
jgi:hypothetical protein